jgi:hypothetical protein
MSADAVRVLLEQEVRGEGRGMWAQGSQPAPPAWLCTQCQHQLHACIAFPLLTSLSSPPPQV